MRETKLWTWHLIAGVVILVLLGLHMATMHAGALTGFMVENGLEEPVAPANVVARDAQLMFTITYVVLLAAGLYHGLYGFRNIVLELTLGPGLEKALNAALILVGLGLFALGTWAAFAAHTAALASGRA